MKKSSILFALSLFFTITLPASAQSSLVLCYNSSTKAITAETKCPSGRTQLSGSNFTSQIGSVNYSKCYKQSGKTSGTPSNGRLSLALACKTASDVVISDEFDTDNTSRAQPSLGSKTIIYPKGSSLPNGMTFEGQAAITSTYYSISAAIVCCPK